jgi:hypothetical protein
MKSCGLISSKYGKVDINKVFIHSFLINGDFYMDSICFLLTCHIPIKDFHLLQIASCIVVIFAYLLDVVLIFVKLKISVDG